jgi:predicted nuclease with TOPRIM domain
MDPITTIIVAAITSLNKDVIKDSYDALKAGFKKKFGERSDLVDAIDKLEKKPESDARKATVQEEVENSNVNEDPDILRLAQDLRDKIREQTGGQEVINQIQINKVQGVTVGHDFEFKPIQEGKKS